MQIESTTNNRGSRVERLNTALRTLQTDNSEIIASALISEDGLILASALPKHIDDVRVGGMSATLSSLGQRAARELELGSVELTLIRGDSSYAVMMKATPETMLLTLATKDAKMGLILLDMNRTANEIRKIL